MSLVLKFALDDELFRLRFEDASEAISFESVRTAVEEICPGFAAGHVVGRFVDEGLSHVLDETTLPSLLAMAADGRKPRVQLSHPGNEEDCSLELNGGSRLEAIEQGAAGSSCAPEFGWTGACFSSVPDTVRTIPEICVAAIPGRSLLDGIVRKAQSDAKLLIISGGNRPGGCKPPARVLTWAEANGFEHKLYCTNPHDQHERHDPRTLGPAEVIARFIEKHRQELHKVVIFHQGHGAREDGAWWPQAPWRLSPLQVAALAAGGNITVVTGCCFGGHWLEYFDGATAASPDEKAMADGDGGFFWKWLFDGAPFPAFFGAQLPMQRGLLSPAWA